jgi:hypothetical protein
MERRGDECDFFLFDVVPGACQWEERGKRRRRRRA